jgi:preprotein translocase subunit SecA
MGLIDRLLGNTSAQQIKKIQPLVKKINALEDGIKKLSDAELRHKTVVKDWRRAKRLISFCRKLLRLFARLPFAPSGKGIMMFSS